jgi:hypothetical protein
MATDGLRPLFEGGRKHQVSGTASKVLSHSKFTTMKLTALATRTVKFSLRFTGVVGSTFRMAKYFSPKLMKNWPEKVQMQIMKNEDLFKCTCRKIINALKYSIIINTQSYRRQSYRPSIRLLN